MFQKNEDMSTIVSEGYYIVEFEGLETEEESFSQYFFSLNFDAYNDGLGVDGITYDSPILIKMIDVLGREQKEHKKGTLLFYIYDNGQVEKRVTH